MELQHLKLLAGLTRGLLENNGKTVSHNQSLDLSAAIPGLRNWPEVQAFPSRVTACELDLSSASRLAFRLKKLFDLQFSPQEILTKLTPPGIARPAEVPHIWPSGPQPGVYITTSHSAIAALLAKYEDATDGGVVYAERAGSHWAGAIDLGDYGLWSQGLDRVPSGTLLVIGPIDLVQDSWSNSADSLDMACLHAANSGHRIAALINTPSPATLFQDVELMVRHKGEPGQSNEDQLIGFVAENGDLLAQIPFAPKLPPPAFIHSDEPDTAIPADVLPILKAAIGKRKSGILGFGVGEIEEHSGMEMIAAALPLTEHAGPVARICPRKRSTPEKDWMVPEAIKKLPFLPSMESAYALGYRRMIISTNYADGELIAALADDVLLMTGSWSSEVEDVYRGVQGRGRMSDTELLQYVVALVGVKTIESKGRLHTASDVFVGPAHPPGGFVKFREYSDYIRENRVLRWEDAMTNLLALKAVTVSGIKAAFKNNRHVADFLAQRDRRKVTKATESGVALH